MVRTLIAVSILGAPALCGAIEIRVVDYRDRGVRSEIVRIPDDNPKGERHLGETADNGVLVIPYACRTGERIKAKPTDQIYLESAIKGCSDKLQLIVPTRRTQNDFDKLSCFDRSPRYGECPSSALDRSNTRREPRDFR